MKLGDWAKKQGIHYQTAWRWWNEGRMPVKTKQMPSGTIMVYEDEETDVWIDKAPTFIPIYSPHNSKKQRKYMLECIETNQICQGKYIEQFEEGLQKQLKVKHAISTSDGDVSLVIILKALGIGLLDEIICQTLIHAATVSSITHVGATAVLCDSDDSLQMDVSKIEALITPQTKAIMISQLYGDSPDMWKLIDICEQHKISLIEDSAEASFCKFEGKTIGSFGIASSFSWFSNKTITTGEGGAICTNDDNLAAKIKLLRNQSHIGSFVHDGAGFNARMTNILAAYGCAQLEVVKALVAHKISIAAYYRTHLSESIKRIIPKIESAEWMPVFLLPDHISFESFYEQMRIKNIDTRPVFKPIHTMAGFNISIRTDLSNSEKLSKIGFNLPSYPDLSNKQIQYICKAVNEIMEKK